MSFGCTTPSKRFWTFRSVRAYTVARIPDPSLSKRQGISAIAVFGRETLINRSIHRDHKTSRALQCTLHCDPPKLPSCRQTHSRLPLWMVLLRFLGCFLLQLLHMAVMILDVLFFCGHMLLRLRSNVSMPFLLLHLLLLGFLNFLRASVLVFSEL
jgi:hypothetical protein